MEQARRARAEDGDEAFAQLHAQAFDGLNNILKLAVAPKDRPPEFGEGRGGPDGRSLMQALELVQRASEAIDQSDQRNREIEARAQALTERATAELASIEARLKVAESGAREAQGRAEAAERRLREAEERADAAERRSRDADEWLERLQSAILAAFSSRLKP